ncbi:hypothetical protein [Photobacterium phosphoreum]|uniref:hypothetical protein n=1 Tax=Photobacterium phosphoreum TaxID=659 RepID=UPI0015E7753A
MFSHIMVGSNNVIKYKRFYDAIMRTLGYEEGVIDGSGRLFHVTYILKGRLRDLLKNP